VNRIRKLEPLGRVSVILKLVIDFQSADIGPIPRKGFDIPKLSTVRGWPRCPLRSRHLFRVYGCAPCEKRMRKSRTAVILQGTKSRIGVRLIACDRAVHKEERCANQVITFALELANAIAVCISSNDGA